MLEINMVAPDFELLDQDGNMLKLSRLRKKLVVVYFYPKDNTPGCTQQACDFRDNIQALSNEACIVLGISKDGPASHKAFKNKYDLNFNLLVDTDLMVHKAYEVLNEDKVVRSTFLIDKEGKIVKIWSNVKVKNHVMEVLETIKALIVRKGCY
jgi:peroxiredoxin Q/BCP